MSTPELFSIRINNISDVFLPGDVVSGFVFKLRSKILTKNVRITCRGKAVASLDGQDFSSNLRFKGIRYLLPKTSKEEYFLLSSICLDDYIHRSFSEADEEEAVEGQADSITPTTSTTTTTTTAGSSSSASASPTTCPPLLFQLKLPRLLPPSCHLHYGFITYDILFEWQSLKPGTENEWEHKVKSLPISIGASVNLNEIPFSGEPAETCKHEKFNFFCYNSGSIDVSMRIETMGYVPGQELHFKVMTNNAAKFDIEKIDVTLRQERTFYVGELKKKFHKTLVSCEGPNVPRGKSITWEDYVIVPEVQLKFFWPCSIIKIAFYLQVKLTAYTYGCSAPKTILENSISILIGDIPVDTELYLERFPLNYGVNELGGGCFSENERFWLGINCLFNGTLSGSQHQHHHENQGIVDDEDLTPSYASAVATTQQPQNNMILPFNASMRSDAESPPPTYQEVMQFFKSPPRHPHQHPIVITDHDDD